MLCNDAARMMERSCKAWPAWAGKQCHDDLARRGLDLDAYDTALAQTLDQAGDAGYCLRVISNGDQAWLDFTSHVLWRTRRSLQRLGALPVSARDGEQCPFACKYRAFVNVLEDFLECTKPQVVVAFGDQWCDLAPAALILHGRDVPVCLFHAAQSSEVNALGRDFHSHLSEALECIEALGEATCQTRFFDTCGQGTTRYFQQCSDEPPWMQPSREIEQKLGLCTNEAQAISLNNLASQETLVRLASADGPLSMCDTSKYTLPANLTFDAETNVISSTTRHGEFEHSMHASELFTFLAAFPIFA
jgi:hypothetical protein